LTATRSATSSTKRRTSRSPGNNFIGPPRVKAVLFGRTTCVGCGGRSRLRPYRERLGSACGPRPNFFSSRQRPSCLTRYNGMMVIPLKARPCRLGCGKRRLS
jgi:hypothetical protein